MTCKIKEDGKCYCPSGEGQETVYHKSRCEGQPAPAASAASAPASTAGDTPSALPVAEASRVAVQVDELNTQAFRALCYVQNLPKSITATVIEAVPCGKWQVVKEDPARPTRPVDLVIEKESRWSWGGPPHVDEAVGTQLLRAINNLYWPRAAIEAIGLLLPTIEAALASGVISLDALQTKILPKLNEVARKIQADPKVFDDVVLQSFIRIFAEGVLEREKGNDERFHFVDEKTKAEAATWEQLARTSGDAYTALVAAEAQLIAIDRLRNWPLESEIADKARVLRIEHGLSPQEARGRAIVELTGGGADPTPAFKVLEKKHLLLHVNVMMDKLDEVRRIQIYSEIALAKRKGKRFANKEEVFTAIKAITNEDLLDHFTESGVINEKMRRMARWDAVAEAEGDRRINNLQDPIKALFAASEALYREAAERGVTSIRPPLIVTLGTAKNSTQLFVNRVEDKRVELNMSSQPAPKRKTTDEMFGGGTQTATDTEGLEKLRTKVKTPPRKTGETKAPAQQKPGKAKRENAWGW